MMHVCKCGDDFETKEQLRQHVALLTPRWPAQRCTAEHYNPLDPRDKEYVERLKTRVPPYRCSCGEAFEYHHQLKNHRKETGHE